MMYSNMEDYERRINELNIQISELQNQVYQLQVLINEKDNQINQLYNENQQLKAQLRNMKPRIDQSPSYGQQTIQPPGPQSPSYDRQTVQPPVIQSPSYDPQIAKPPIINQPASSFVTTETDPSFHKRECPKCGASGFAIKEVEDKSRLLSYVPRRIYAKKRVCTKCFYEW